MVKENGKKRSKFKLQDLKVVEDFLENKGGRGKRRGRGEEVKFDM